MATSTEAKGRRKASKRARSTDDEEKIDAPLKTLPGVFGEEWTVVSLPAADTLFEPINLAFEVRRPGEDKTLHFTLECIDYGKRRIQKHKGKTYATDPNTRANLERRSQKDSVGGIISHVYLNKDGYGDFIHFEHEDKILIRRGPVYLYDPGQ